MPILNMIYGATGGGGGGWQPSANTVAYYPFDTDYSDQSGNGYDLTNKGATSIGNRGGVGCAVFIKDSNSGLYSSAVPYTGISTSMTFSMWLYIDQFNTSENNVLGIGEALSGNCIILWQLNPIKTGGWGGYECNTSITPPTQTWFNVVVTQTSSGTNIYYNGVLSATSNTYSTLAGNEFNVGYFNGSSALNRKYIGGMSNLILESKARTAEEVANYYNSTKGNYGL